MLKAFKDLGSAHRGDPCLEYPGEWILYLPSCLFAEEGSSETFDSQGEAQYRGIELMERLEKRNEEYDPRDFRVCWSASDDDPRTGEVWFTGFYMHGRFNAFGEYRTT